MRASLRLRRLRWLILPLLLVLAQQAQLRHEYSQHSTPVESQRKSPDGDRCATCLAFAQVAGIATAAFAAAVPTLDLAFHHGAERRAVAVDARPLAARSRGPPAFANS